jgi:hypothetical protein
MAKKRNPKRQRNSSDADSGPGKRKKQELEYYLQARGQGHNCSMVGRRVNGAMYTHCTCGIGKDGEKRGCGRLYFVRDEDKAQWAPHCANAAAGASTPDSLQKWCYVCHCHVAENQKYTRTRKSGPPVGNFQIGPVLSVTMSAVGGGDQAPLRPEGGPRPEEELSSAPDPLTRISRGERRLEKIQECLRQARLLPLMEEIDGCVGDLVGERLSLAARAQEEADLKSKRDHKSAQLKASRELRDANERASNAMAERDRLQGAVDALQTKIKSLTNVSQATDQIKSAASRFEGDCEVSADEVMNALTSDTITLASLVWRVIGAVGKEKGTSRGKKAPPGFYIMYCVLHAANQKVNSLFVDLALAGSFSSR